MKKTLKITLGIILVFILLVVAIPFVFKDKIIAKLETKVDESVNAKLKFDNIDLSILKNFPNATVNVNGFAIINKAPFEGDTLFQSKSLTLKLSLIDVINSNLDIKSFIADQCKVAVKVNKNGKANYDIAKPSEKSDEEHTDSNSQKITVQNYSITNSSINYSDATSGILLSLTDLNHSGSGDLSADRTTLKTNTNVKINFNQGKKNLISKLHLDLKADLDLDLKNNKYSFLKNEAHINQLPLIFDGHVKLLEKSQFVAITFKTPSSDFKNFLSLVPSEYKKGLKDVKTTGSFAVKGNLNGTVDDKHIPKINIAIQSNNASFKVPDLPKSIRNIKIDTEIVNTTGLIDDTYVNLNNLAFKIDDNAFKASSKITKLTTNPNVTATLNGKLNLGDIKNVYPIDKELKISGLLQANLTTSFDAEAIEKSISDRIKNNGSLSLNNFEYKSKDLNNPLLIKNASVDFKPKTILLTNFEAKTGATDIKATGTIEDLIGFMISNKKLKGRFNLTSNTFKVIDFMQSETTTTTDEKSNTTGDLKIPEFLDIDTKFTATKVLYDNLVLKNVKGSLVIKDQKATLKDINATMFNGTISLNGSVNTKNKIPNFDMKMGIKHFDITSSFSQIEMLGKLAPISKIISGNFNSDINLSGKLTKELTPDMTTIKGSAFAALLKQKFTPKKSKTLKLLGDNLNFINIKDLNLKDLKAKLSFKDGKVNIAPFKIKYKDIPIQIQGSHGFDQKMNYNVNFNVPAKYLGSRVRTLLNKLDASNKNASIPVKASVTGNFDNPKVRTDVSAAKSKLITQLKRKATSSAKKQVKKQVNRVKKQVKDKLINSFLKDDSSKGNGKNKQKQTKDPKELIKKRLNGLFGG